MDKGEKAEGGKENRVDWKNLVSRCANCGGPADRPVPSGRGHPMKARGNKSCIRFEANSASLRCSLKFPFHCSVGKNWTPRFRRWGKSKAKQLGSSP